MNEKLSFFTNQLKVVTQEEIKMEILSHFGRVKKLLGSSGGNTRHGLQKELLGAPGTKHEPV